jgi:hypothetical protein
LEERCRRLEARVADLEERLARVERLTAGQPPSAGKATRAGSTHPAVAAVSPVIPSRPGALATRPALAVGDNVYDLPGLLAAIPPEFAHVRNDEATAVATHRYKEWVKRNLAGRVLSFEGALFEDEVNQSGGTWTATFVIVPAGGAISDMVIVKCQFPLATARERAATMKKGDLARVTGAVRDVTFSKPFFSDKASPSVDLTDCRFEK